MKRKIQRDKKGRFIKGTMQVEGAGFRKGNTFWKKNLIFLNGRRYFETNPIKGAKCYNWKGGISIGKNQKEYRNKIHREYNKRHAKELYVEALKIRKNRRIELINLKGNKCVKCGIKYNGENGAIFVFHHSNSTEREFLLIKNNMGKKWETLLKEVNKCILVCQNCHTLIHSHKY